MSHKLRSSRRVSAWDAKTPEWLVTCACGWTSREHGETDAAAVIAAHVEAERTRALDWFNRTGHCATCGQPGDYCQCRQPCLCADLHPVGSGLDADPSVVFAVPVSDDQQELF